ncbi:hypothetical protein KOW79_011421 [Hemibagrus wyckioides]|uniref:Uncharacterized protein n=1 Tax=Hemibagrus wyckioides TaxID=337641 RepID=A0A9D3NMY3_9TELE|nr:hypothetical protein KOW79_011421 [Hemibagrus wyckioides]
MNHCKEEYVERLSKDERVVFLPEHIPPPPSLSAHVGTVRISTQTAIQPIDIHLSQKGLIIEVVMDEAEGNAWVQCHSGLTMSEP